MGLRISKVHEDWNLGKAIICVYLLHLPLVLVSEHVSTTSLINSVILGYTNYPLVYHRLEFKLVSSRVFSHNSMGFSK